MAAKKARGARVKKAPPTNGATIADALAEVQAALQQAQNTLATSGSLRFTAATLTLQSVVTVSAGAKFSFLIFSFGQTWEKEKAHEMVLVMTPPKAVLGVGKLAPPSLSQELVAAIVDAAEGIKAAEGGVPPLSAKSFKVNISFVVNEQVGAGLKLDPIYLELKGDLKKKALHKLELLFERPSTAVAG